MGSCAQTCLIIAEPNPNLPEPNPNLDPTPNRKPRDPNPKFTPALTLSVNRCAQTCRNSWSSVCYNNLTATFASRDRPGEPDWDLVRRRKPQHLEESLCHGPYFHRKAERIHALCTHAYTDFGEGTDL